MIINKNHFFKYGFLLVFVLLICSNAYLYFGTRKIAFVRSQELIEKYRGTIEARSEFERKKNSLMVNVDSLTIDFERAKNHYVGTMSHLTSAERENEEKVLSKRQFQLKQYSDAIEQKIEEENMAMTQGILNQINSYIEDYAIHQNYSLVLGTTSSGNLLYGEKALDITDKLLLELNNHYKGR